MGDALSSTLLGESDRELVAQMLPVSRAPGDVLRLQSTMLLRGADDMHSLWREGDGWRLEHLMRWHGDRATVRYMGTVRLDDDTGKALATRLRAGVACSPDEVRPNDLVHTLVMPDGSIQEREIPPVDGGSVAYLHRKGDRLCAVSERYARQDSYRLLDDLRTSYETGRTPKP